MTLDSAVFVARYPYAETIPTSELVALLESVVRARSADIEARFTAGEYERNRMAFVLLDPTTPASADSAETVLAIGVIGPEGDFFAPNALAKAICLRDYGADGSTIVAAQNHRAPDGSFRHGGAVEVDGTIVGGSGQTPAQDRYQSTILAAEFNYLVGEHRLRWEREHGPGRWYRNEQAPPSRFAEVVDRIVRA